MVVELYFILLSTNDIKVPIFDFSLQARIEEMPLGEEIPEEKFDWDQFNHILLQALKVFVPVKQQQN